MIFKGKAFFQIAAASLPQSSKIACHPDPASAGEGSL
jgi:hypothetical protein